MYNITKDSIVTIKFINERDDEENHVINMREILNYGVAITPSNIASTYTKILENRMFYLNLENRLMNLAKKCEKKYKRWLNGKRPMAIAEVQKVEKSKWSESSVEAYIDNNFADEIDERQDEISEIYKVYQAVKICNANVQSYIVLLESFLNSYSNSGKLLDSFCMLSEIMHERKI